MSSQELSKDRNDIIKLLKRIIEAVFYPPYLDRTANRTRGTVIIESGTVTTVGTVTVVTGLTNLDGWPARQLINNNNQTNWALNVRERIS